MVKIGNDGKYRYLAPFKKTFRCEGTPFRELYRSLAGKTHEVSGVYAIEKTKELKG
jgi:hypothetical protein